MKLCYTNKNGKLYFCDILTGLKTLPDKSVNSVITSPPYWQLRDYGFPDQWGLEPTYQEYLEHLWQMMDEIWRVLRDDGTVWINLGDTYSAGGRGSSCDLSDKQKSNTGTVALANLGSRKPPEGMKSKCLLLIPHRFAIGCIDRGWIMRNDIIWAKRNGMPESCRDRFSKKHEYFFFMVKQQKYYFDLDGVRDKHSYQDKRGDNRVKYFGKSGGENEQSGSYMGQSTNGKNPGDVSDFWNIPTKPSSKKHYATYNFDLIDKCIIAGCPEFVCKKCGKPRVKIIEKIEKEYYKKEDCSTKQFSKSHHSEQIQYENLGLTDCGCNAGFEGGTILDPFNGTGTTTLRADQLNRKWIGLDGSEEYSKIAKKSMENEFNQIKLEF